MQEPEHYSAVRYLTAKVAVDNDALNARVFAALEKGVAATEKQALRVIELGAGVGSTFRRLYERGIIHSGEYVMVDRDVEALEEASRVTNAILDDDGRAELSVSYCADDAIEYLNGESKAGRGADVIVGQAFVDLVNVLEFVRAAASVLRPGRLLYLPITFDGETVFWPPIDAERDERIITAYHATMDAHQTPDGLPTGGTKAGRTLLRALPSAGLEIMAAGSSDWVVFPGSATYSQDVAYFLHHIINFVWESLQDNEAIPRDELQEWNAARHAQINRGELVYIAHQLDVLARRPE